MSPQVRWSRFRSSFQFKLFSIFSVLTLLTACLLSILYIVNQNRTTRQHVTDQLHLRTKHLADSARLPLYAENRDLLRQLAEQAAQAPEIRSITITTPDGRVLTDVRSAETADSSGSISQTVSVHSNQLIDSIESAIAGSRDESVSLIGTVRMERSTADVARALRHMIMLSACTAIIFWLSVSLLCHLVLQRVTRSFHTLLHGIDVLQDGDFTSRIAIESNDEPATAARAINNLAQALQVRNEENILLHQEHLKMERQMLQAQKLESLGIMAGGIAHDFNNLLQAMLGNLELASIRLASDSAAHKHIRHAINSAKRASLLTGMMLTYLGQGLSAKKELNLNVLVRENADMLKTIASSSVSMELDLSSELPGILADEAHIQQVVMNLITNAAEAIEEQPGLIKLTTGVQICDQVCLAASLLEEKPGPGCYVYVEVSDNGCGMSAETQQRLFDPFFTTKFTGRGLGMSAVLGIMKAHNGALFVESQPGTGTTFRVLFPTVESAPSAPLLGPASPAPEAVTPPERPFSGIALVVDDEKSVLKICTKMVKLCGLSVITACDGIEAVAKFREHVDEIVVVLMDLTMPNMDGISAMREIHSIKPDAKVILSSGFNENELLERITSQPPSGFIRKPYSMNMLETELRRILQKG